MSFFARCLYRFEHTTSSEAREQHRRIAEDIAEFERWTVKIAGLCRRIEQGEPGFMKRLEAKRRIIEAKDQAIRSEY